MSTPDNPPAFPTEWSHSLEPGEPMQTGQYTAQYPGMTLRDWFAGQALAGRCFSLGEAGEGWTHEEIARECYGQADAMLAERERQP